MAMENFDSIIAGRIANELNKRRIRQVELLALCKKIGMPVSQPDISRIYAGKKTLSLYQCAALCKVLNMPMDFLVWGEDKSRVDFCDPHGAEGLHDEGRELKWYLGEYYFYYLSTASGEDKILKGKLNIEQENEFCSLTMLLNTGVKDMRGEWICKEYSGRILVSSALGVAYLILKSEAIGEICMLCFRHRNYSIQDMECRIGLVLTASAGESKEPTVHKSLLVRCPLSDEQSEALRPWLKLSGDTIRIEKKFLCKVLKQAQERYPAYEDQLVRIGSQAVSREVVDLSVEMLRRQLTMKREEFVEFVSLLYEEAEISQNYKISSSDDIRLYEKVGSIRNIQFKENAEATFEGG